MNFIKCRSSHATPLLMKNPSKIFHHL
jgi:hypothetical protein